MYAVQTRSVQEFPDVSVISGGQVSAERAEQLARAVGGVLARHGVAGGARVRLKTGNCGSGPVVVQVNLRVHDRPVRVQTATTGIDDLAPALDRLDHQIHLMGAPWSPRPWPDPSHRPLTVPDDAVVVRRKLVALQRISPSQAAEVMDEMDYDAHLFTDVEAGEDAVVYRSGPSGLRLARQFHVFPPGWSSLSTGPESSGPGSAEPGPALPIVVNSTPVPVLDERAAVERACRFGARMLFYTDPTSGRGRLLYPRYDGNLGIVAPLGDSGAPACRI